MKIFLRISGGVCLVAVVPFLMPRGWIVACHEWLGLGAFPAQPVAEYLARFTSALCAFYGGLLWALSADVRRFARVIRYQAVAMIVMSLTGLVLTIRSGMPVYWAVGDATGACTIGVVSLVLLRAFPTSDSPQT
ncbi:MAG: hypothetical protein ABIP48_30020 [Planctomycetota bacterium]